MNLSLYELLSQEFPQLSFLKNEPLSRHTYFKIGGPAEVFTIVKQKQDLQDLVSFCRKQHIPLMILGGASNVLVSDNTIPGLVIKNMTSDIAIHSQSDQKAEVTADSGVITNMLVRKTIDEGLEGLEYFLGVPGTIGGAVYNNSHFMTQLIGDHVKEVTVVDMVGDVKTYTQQELHFAYDYSILHETKDIILSITFQLQQGDKNTLEERAKHATHKRASTQPLGIPSSGCMFQNAVFPDGKRVSAGYLIDQAGLKGMRVGDAMVSDKHANFIVNLGSATAADVDELARKVQKTIKEKFGVELKREVFSLG